MKRLKHILLGLLAVVLLGAVAFFGVAPRWFDRNHNTVAQAPPYVASEAARRLPCSRNSSWPTGSLALDMS